MTEDRYRLRLDFERLRAVRLAKTGNLGDLARIAGLDPVTDFRFADWQGADWTGTDKSAFNLEGALEGPPNPEMETYLERQRLLDALTNAGRLDDRHAAAQALLKVHSDDKTVQNALIGQLLTDRSETFYRRLLKHIPSLPDGALTADIFERFVLESDPHSGSYVRVAIRWIKLGGDPVFLSSLTKLTSYDPWGSQVRDIRPLAGLIGLTDLKLSFTKVTDLAPLSSLTGLTNLNLMYTGVSDLAPLSSLTDLKSLNLERANVSDLAPLSGLTDLKSLNLERTNVSDLAPLSGLTDLKSLNLASTKVNDLTPLSGLTGLKSLNLMGTNVGDLNSVQRIHGLLILDS